MHLRRTILVLFLIVCAVSTEVSPTVLSTPTSTLPPPSLSTSPSTSSTTTSPTTSTTTSPTTSTSTSPSTSSTTTSPSTTSTTSKPNPPNPNTVNWVVVDEETNVTCIVVKLAASFIIPFNTSGGKMENATMILPVNATSNGTCNGDYISNSQSISLNWVVADGHPNMLTLVFLKNSSGIFDKMDANEQFYLSEISLNVYPDSENFPNSSKDSYINGRNFGGNFHPVQVNNSYRCNSEENIQLHSVDELDVASFVGTVKFSHVQMEAFRKQMNDKFNSAVDCAADKVITSDIVPIAVGCALAALVVIVLVAYLIGRRRARQRGYQSV